MECGSNAPRALDLLPRARSRGRSKFSARLDWQDWALAGSRSSARAARQARLVIV